MVILTGNNMAASTKSHADNLDVEIIVGSYEHVLFGYELVKSHDSAILNLSFTDKSHCASIRSLAVSSKNLLASGSADETIQLFDLKLRQEAGTLIKHSGTITNIEFYDEFMISSDDAGVICIWKISGRSYECMKTLSGHKGSVLSMSVHPSGKLLLSVGQDKTIRTWNLVTAKRAYTTNIQNVVDILRWSPDGEKYVLCYNGKLDVCLIAKAAPESSIKLPGKAHSLAFLNNNIVVVGCEGGSLAFVDIDAGVAVHDFKVDCNRIKCLSVKPFTANQSLLSFMSNDGLMELHLINIEGSQQVSTSLIAATKTILRPICMELVVKSEVEEQTSTVQQADENVKKHKVGKKRQRDAVQQSVKELSEEELPPYSKKSAQVSEADSKVKSNKRRSKQTASQQKPKMDKIKKAFSTKPKTAEADEDEDLKGKKHIKPVDSVKITKQKFNEKRKQAHAKHHHLAQDTEAKT